MKRRKRSMTEAIADAFRFPDTVSATVPDIHIIGTREISIDGCVGILSYERDSILLRLRDRCARITGTDLTLKTYYTGHVSVKGRIMSLSFEEGL
ncbi:MAG: YabP/YqfC family sporulation protein [Clostridia bacterium]|nr:YabP/YqfC family sporulation protein [Clostridia bacterium]